MRTALLIFSGMVLMYILLKVMSSKDPAKSESWTKIKSLIETQKFNNLIKTNEFRELSKTNEFRSLIGTLANEQISVISKTLVG